MGIGTSVQLATRIQRVLESIGHRWTVEATDRDHVAIGADIIARIEWSSEAIIFSAADDAVRLIGRPVVRPLDATDDQLVRAIAQVTHRVARGRDLTGQRQAALDRLRVSLDEFRAWFPGIEQQLAIDPVGVILRVDEANFLLLVAALKERKS